MDSRAPTISPMSFIPRGGRTSINDFLQLRRDRQALEHADVGTARIADRDDADSRADHAQNEAKGLSKRGGHSPATDFQREHQPVRLRMCAHESLADDMSALQVSKGALGIPRENELAAASDLSVECQALTSVHRAPGSGNVLPAEAGIRILTYEEQEM